MLKQCFALLLTLCCLYGRAQNDLIVLTESGAFFTLYLDDQRINDSAQSIVLARSVYHDTCTVKLVFADAKLSPFSDKIYLREKGKHVAGREFTYSLAEEKGKKRLRFISVNNILSDTGRKSYPPEEKIRAIFEQLARQRAAYQRANELYPEPANCTQAIADSTLARNLQLLRDNHIELKRLKNAKWFISNNCLTTKQLLGVLETFHQGDSKMAIAKFSYPYLYNSRDFLELLPAMQYAQDKEELEKFFHKRIEK